MQTHFLQHKTVSVYSLDKEWRKANIFCYLFLTAALLNRTETVAVLMLAMQNSALVEINTNIPTSHLSLIISVVQN